MSGNNILCMASPVKVIIMNMQSNTSVRCNSIQSGVIISGQMCQYQVIACQVSDSMSIIQCHISGVRCQVITCQVPMSDIECQVSGVKCNISILVSDIKCQRLGVKYNISVPVSDIKCKRSGVKYNISVSTSYINSYSDVSCTKSHNSNY